jgi:SPP1 family predicted phage head-tail adaptor
MLHTKYVFAKFDRRIVIQEKTNTSDTYNQPVPTWATFATVWASVDDRSGGESFQADQLTAYRNTVFTIRYLSGLNETMRIKYNLQYYNIRMIKSPDRKRSLEITAELLDDPAEVLGGGFTSGFTVGFNVS